MSKRAIIIGAGPGGLAASLLLAKAGLRVTVLEKRGQIGGRTSAIEAQGFRFDCGPTFFLFPLALERIFSAIGRDLQTEIPMVRLDPQYHLIFGSGGDILASPNLKKLEDQVAKLSVHDALALRRFIDDNRVKLARFQHSLESPFHRWRDVCTLPMLKMLPLLRPWLSLDGELGRYFDDPRVRLAFSFQSKYLGMSPFNCPSLFSILSFLEYEHGVHHPIGGCASVTEGMAKIAEEVGVEIRTDVDVQEIQFEGRKAVGVRTAEGVERADAVVVNGDFSQVVPRLIPEKLRRRWPDKTVAKKRYSCSTFMMYLGLDGTVENLAHHTIYMAKDYVGNLHDIERDHKLSDDPSLYIQNPCNTDPSLAPPGRSTLYVLAPVSHLHENIDWAQEKERFRGIVLGRLAKLGLPNLERRIRFEKITTPLDWQCDYSTYRGATFSMAHNLAQMLHLRPRNRYDDVDGVYLVGGGTHPGSGLPVIFESARISARLLLDDLGVSRGFIDVPSSLAVPEYAG